MVAAQNTGRDIPPLENGMRLERDEFHALFAAHPEIKKAELVDGMVFLQGRIPFRRAEFQGLFSMWTGSWAIPRPDASSATWATVILSATDEVMPCALVRRLNGGRSYIDDEGYLHGPPDLIVEVAASSASFDLHVKRDAYRRAGVPEYIVFQVFERKPRWFRLDGEAYREVEPDGNGAIESAQFPGLVLNVTALEAGDERAAVGQ